MDEQVGSGEPSATKETKTLHRIKSSVSNKIEISIILEPDGGGMRTAESLVAKLAGLISPTPINIH
jgi:hypothetical protein